MSFSWNVERPKNLNVADFQCERKGKYTLYVNIHVSSCDFYNKCTTHSDRTTNTISVPLV